MAAANRTQQTGGSEDDPQQAVDESDSPIAEPPTAIRHGPARRRSTPPADPGSDDHWQDNFAPPPAASGIDPAALGSGEALLPPAQRPVLGSAAVIEEDWPAG